MSHKINHSMSLAKPDAGAISTKQKMALATGVIGLFILVLALFNTNFPNKAIFLTLALSLIVIGIIVYSRDAYLTTLEGIKNNGVWFKSISSRGVWDLIWQFRWFTRKVFVLRKDGRCQSYQTCAGAGVVAPGLANVVLVERLVLEVFSAPF